MIGWLLIIWVGCLLWPSVGAAQEVKRCRNAQGLLVYTDKPCDLVGAVPVLAKPPTEEGARLADGSPKHVRTFCPNRTPNGLVQALTSALQSRDANRVAGLFHWVGSGGKSATAKMQRIQRMADRQTVEVRLVHVRQEALDADHHDRFIQRPPQGWPRDLGVVDQRMTQRQMRSRSPDGIPRIRRTPIQQASPQRRIKQGLPRVEISQQMTGAYQVNRQLLGLRKHAGCVWLTF